MKKHIALALTIIFCLSLMEFWTPAANAEAEIPEWKVGDKWEFVSSNVNIVINLTIEIKNITTINVNNIDYNVYVVNSSSMTTISGANFTEYRDKYISIDDLTTVKENVFFIGALGEQRRMETIFEPPEKEYNFPLSVGKTWTSIYNQTDNVEGEGIFTLSRSYNYTVIGEENINVPAGTFECYKIEWDDGSEENYYFWYSPEVKNLVKTTGGTEEIPWAVQLASYNISIQEDNGGDNGTDDNGKDNGFDLFAMPYILVIMLIPIIVIIIIAWLIKFRKRE